jgi:hypothetical protein
MRAIAFAFVLVLGVFGSAAAQSVQFENFDRGGLPAKPQTAEERELFQRISGHRRGDMADTADIQRRLAQYYRAKGDTNRARMAEDRANAAASYDNPGAAPQFGTVPAPAYGNPQRSRPNYNGPRSPNYGNMPMPVYGTMPARRSNEPEAPMLGAPVRPAPGETTPPPAGSAIPVYEPETPAPGAVNETTQASEAAAPAATEPPPAAPVQDAGANPAAAQPSAFSGRYFVLQGPTMHTWEFRPDGTFEHAWTAARGGGAANIEAGTFQAVGPYLTLFVMRGTGYAAGAGRRNTRRMTFQMRGAGGQDGIMLDGLVLRPKP